MGLLTYRSVWYFADYLNNKIFVLIRILTSPDRNNKLHVKCTFPIGGRAQAKIDRISNGDFQGR